MLANKEQKKALIMLQLVLRCAEFDTDKKI